MSSYPLNIGKRLDKTPFPKEQIEELKKILQNQKYILRVYGLAGVGKGTLSENLASTLELPNIESSLILRCLTYLYEDLSLELNPSNTESLYDEMKVEVVDNQFQFIFRDKLISKPQLKTSFIDSKVPFYSQDFVVRHYFDLKLREVTQNIVSGSCVADGRGAYEPYLIDAESKGVRVIRLLLDSSDEVKIERYYQGFVKSEKKNNPEYKENAQDKERIENEFKNTIIARNNRDIQNILDKTLGLISNDSGFIDTSYLTPQEVLETALNFIFKNI